MNLSGIKDTVIEHWLRYHRSKVSSWPTGELERQAAGVAQLAEAELQALEKIGVDRQNAWPDIRNSIVLKPPQDIS
jgi:hypothetical protein